MADARDPHTNLHALRAWFYAAAIYNLLWGTWVVLFPSRYFELIGMPPPEPLAIWQVVGMCILVYAPAYWWVAKDPFRFRHYALIGLLGKVLGPVGFGFSWANGALPLEFGLTLLTNDLVWWPGFLLFLYRAQQASGGWLKLVTGG